MWKIIWEISLLNDIVDVTQACRRNCHYKGGRKRLPSERAVNTAFGRTKRYLSRCPWVIKLRRLRQEWRLFNDETDECKVFGKLETRKRIGSSLHVWFVLVPLAFEWITTARYGKALNYFKPCVFSCIRATSLICISFIPFWGFWGFGPSNAALEIVHDCMGKSKKKSITNLRSRVSWYSGLLLLIPLRNRLQLCPLRNLNWEIFMRLGM